MPWCRASGLPPTCSAVVAHVADKLLEVLSPTCERARFAGRSLKTGDEIGRLLDIEGILHID